MMDRTRREFLSDVGKGMLVASMGAALATDLGLSTALADSEKETLTFGRFEPLADLMQETPIDRLLPTLVDKIHSGTDLKTLVAAGALANARTFGGEDYVGFHAFMALAPAYHMSHELPADKRALPVLKVLYRSCSQIQNLGGRAHEVLHPVTNISVADGAESLREFTRRPDVETAERVFAGIVAKSPEDGFNAIQPMIEDDADVHRVVLAYRAWAMMGLAGRDYAHTLLRQTVRYCAKSEQGIISRGAARPAIREALPKILDQYKLLEKKLGDRRADDAWVAKMAENLVMLRQDQAADAMAAALADGISPESLHESLALASNLEVLRDPGRTVAYPGKPIGSVHGDSIGVHASDSMNAWINIGKVSNHRNRVASLVVAAYHAARGNWDAPKLNYSLDAQLEEARKVEAAHLLEHADAAIKEKNQALAAALIQRYGELDMPSRPVFDMMLKYATSEDGSLHAEKYYRTVSEEFGRTRPSLRWRHLVGLARVTASEYGKRADGYEEACKLLKV